MNVLVDYDNVDPVVRQRGVVHVLERIIDALGGADAIPDGRLHVRLYGGWYEAAELSKNGQIIAAQVAAEYPRVEAVTTSTGTHRIRVSAEMAYSMIIDPRTSLSHTFRQKSAPYNLRTNAPPFDGCAGATECPIRGVHKLIRRKRCPTDNCGVELGNVIYRAEQKLVDTMLTADLLHLASTSEDQPIAVVSSDDDLWPGIRSALLMGSRILHVHPKAGRVSPPHYRLVDGLPYVEYAFSGTT
jgi:uncharacterized LabA/DUF88 family protein